MDEALAMGQRMRKPAMLAEHAPSIDAEGTIIGVCPAMREVYKAIGRVAGQSVPVLITGESGTGKELVARALYQHGPRARGPFRALNCAAIPESLLESELFGHEKGAFTGADRRRIGKFEQCNGGTLLLDEVGDMPLAVQAKILRLLQEQTFDRVGGNETVHTDVRLIAATHRDLKQWSAEEKFRPDLYYRLSVFTIHLPPLRERGEDLLMLVRFFLRQFSGELGREVRDVSSEALARLDAYDWPGNVRELQSVLQQALLQATGTMLLPEFLPAELVPEAQKTQASGNVARHRPRATLAELEREAIQQCLLETGGNRQRSAELLGISTRTLLRKIRDYKLEDPRRPPRSGTSESP
jgi:two-component system nitrogen regulation response regulator GlnG